MVVLKIMGKILLVPVWILVAMMWLIVKIIVSVYSLVRGFVALGLGVLIIGTLFCYQDLRQVFFLFSISGITILVLLLGVLTEASLELLKVEIGKIILV